MNSQCHTFHNPISTRWLAELVASRGVTRLMAPHHQILSEPDQIDVALCWQALASAEVVAACYSQNHDRIPDTARQWLKRRQGLYARRCKITADQAQLAGEAIRLAIASPDFTEWRCCNECGNHWLELQQELLSRLEQQAVQPRHHSSNHIRWQN